MSIAYERELELISLVVPGKAHLSLKEFAKLIGLNESSIYSMVSRGEIAIEGVRLGRRFLIPVDRAAEFISHLPRIPVKARKFRTAKSN